MILLSELLKVTLIGLFFGTFGTTIGGIIGIKFKNPSDKILSFILSFASGLMTAILSFDLIPEALKISSIPNAVMGIVLGIICMIICNIAVDKKFKIKNSKTDTKRELLRTGIITSIGLALHNFPEGLAIGSGFGASLRRTRPALVQMQGRCLPVCPGGSRASLCARICMYLKGRGSERNMPGYRQSSRRLRGQCGT